MTKGQMIADLNNALMALNRLIKEVAELPEPKPRKPRVRKFIRWRRIDDGIRIIDQSHRGKEFGDGLDGHMWTAPNGIALRSDCYPEGRDGYAQAYVRGSVKVRDRDLITGRRAFLDRVIAAFKAYNDAHAGPKAKAKPTKKARAK